MAVVDEIGTQLSTVTTRRTVVKTGVKLAYAVPVVAATMKLSSHGVLAASGGNCLGTHWDESESGWTGNWNQVAGNHFSAVWTGPGYVTADLEITIKCVENGKVRIVRTNSSDANDCTYDGVFDGVNSSVSGTYNCNSGGPYNWSATIS